MTAKKEMTKQEESVSALAHNAWTKAVNANRESRRQLLIFGSNMKVIRDNKLWKALGHTSFEAMCCEPEISLKPKTVDAYIKVYEKWIEKYGFSFDEVSGIEYNKFALLEKTKNPKKYFDDARTLGYKDLRKKINADRGTPEAEETESYSSRTPHEHSGSCEFFSVCPFQKAKRSPKGVDVDLALAKPAGGSRIGRKNTGLID